MLIRLCGFSGVVHATGIFGHNVPRNFCGIRLPVNLIHSSVGFNGPEIRKYEGESKREQLHGIVVAFSDAG